MVWKNNLISGLSSVLETIKKLDTLELKIIFVLNEQEQLIGTVTDGDIRRGLLKGIDLKENISLLMNQKPVSFPVGVDNQEMLDTMKHARLTYIPILNTKSQIIDVKIAGTSIGNFCKDNWVVIMAGGLGSRLGELTENIPKPLLMIGEKPILETILENLINSGFENFYFSVNYKSKMIMDYFGDGSKWNCKIKYLQEDKKLGTAGGLSLLKEKPSAPILLMNGDVLTNIDFQSLFDFHLKKEADATICVKEYDIQVPYGVVDVKNDFVQKIEEKPVHTFFINAGIYVLSPNLLEEIPKDQYFDITELFHKILTTKKIIAGFPIREYWMDIGQKKDYEKALGDFHSVFRAKS